MAASNGQQGGGVAGLQIQGGAAIVAPVSAFPNGVPGNALIVVPISKPTDELMGMLEQGPTAVTPEQMWKLLGFNGPAVQVQDDQGRPIAIGLEDLLSGLDKHWQEQPDDLNRGRIYAQELLKHNRLQRAEQVLSKLVAKGGTGDDWLALGVAQLNAGQARQGRRHAEGRAEPGEGQPVPLAPPRQAVQQKKGDEREREWVEKALGDRRGQRRRVGLPVPVCKQRGRRQGSKAVAELEGAPNPNAAPYIAIQGFFANEEETRDKALTYAKKAVEEELGRSPRAALPLGAARPEGRSRGGHHAALRRTRRKMSRDVRLANNYFEALFQSRQIEKVTKLLNALAGSPNKEVKQFAIERSRS
jgi:hypothetical protein